MVYVLDDLGTRRSKLGTARLRCTSWTPTSSFSPPLPLPVAPSQSPVLLYLSGHPFPPSLSPRDAPLPQETRPYHVLSVGNESTTTYQGASSPFQGNTPLGLPGTYFLPCKAYRAWIRSRVTPSSTFTFRVETNVQMGIRLISQCGH